jgi:hypothetical protein
LASEGGESKLLFHRRNKKVVAARTHGSGYSSRFISGGPLDQDRLRQLGEIRVIVRNRQHCATDENRECDNRCFEHGRLPSL